MATVIDTQNATFSRSHHPGGQAADLRAGAEGLWGWGSDRPLAAFSPGSGWTQSNHPLPWPRHRRQSRRQARRKPQWIVEQEALWLGWLPIRPPKCKTW